MYSLDIPIIGLTGGIATGKSAVSSRLKQKGVPVIDADALVKQIYRLESTRSLVREIAPAALGSQPGSEINFKRLRELFFQNRSVQDRLEKHVYQLLPETFLRAARQASNADFLVYDVPLLFENKLEEKVDLAVLVYAPRSVQRERLIKRDGIDSDLADAILNKQMDIEAKKGMADYIIKNDLDFNHLDREVDNFLKTILSAL